MWAVFALSLPQLLTLLLLAVVAAFLAELIVGNAPAFGFVGAIVTALVGAWLFINLPWFQMAFEPQLEDIPVVRAILGGVLVSSLFSFVKKKRSV